MAGPEKQTFAGYEIIAKLGQGGMGAVFKARQPNLDRLAALKIMTPDLASDPDFVARFRREAAAAASLSHPNVVQVYSAGESEGTHYIAMEFVDGQTLRDHIEQNGRLDPREAVAITVYVAEALQYAWNRAKLIHRDIKPENIFLSKAGEVKVGDLGLAKTVGGQTTSLTQTGTAMGSPHYISPEQATGAKDMDFRTDIYSLGGTLYHMLTGQTPYSGDSSMVVMMKHVNEPPPAIFKVWPQCPMPLGLLVGKMLAKNRNSRPASYEELIEQLRALHDKLKPATVPAAAPVSPSDPTQRLTPTPRPAPAPAQPTPKPVVTKTPTVAPKARESKPVTRDSRLVIGGAVAVAVLLLGGLFFWSPWTKPSTPSDTFIREVAALPAEQQVQRVVAELKKLNPEFDGQETHVVEDGVVTELVLSPNASALIRDISPVRALAKLQKLRCTGNRNVGGISPLADLSPLAGSRLTDLTIFGTSVRDLSSLKGMPLESLTWSGCAVTDLSSLAGMPLKFFSCYDNKQLRDLSPLKGAPLTGFNCGFTAVDDLSPLRDAPLNRLEIEYTQVRDLSVLRGKPITSLDCRKTPISDFSPLKDTPITSIHCDFVPARDTAVLRSIKTLKNINNLPAAEFWKQVDSGKLAAGAQPTAASPKFGVLFDGRDTSAWQQRGGGDCQWEVRNGALVAGQGDLDTREKFQDFKLHVEFAVSRDAKQGNSGIYLQGRYEVQILDSYGKPADDICCGSIFRLKAPTENASKPADEWQTFDIGFRAAQFDASGAKTANARVSVLHNGKLIHDYVEIPKSTGKGEPESAAPGPIRLQAYGSPVRFRNISIRPVDEAATAASATDGAWVPLDISAVCNRSTILPEPGKPVHQPFGLTGNSWVTTGWLRARKSDKAGVPDDGRVAIPGANPTGFFQLRVGPGDDCILLSIQHHRRDRGRDIPKTITLDVPANQQRKFSQLAFLHASEPGDAEISVTLHYDTGEDGKDILHSRVWARDRRKEPLTENETAVPASDASMHPVDMMAETLPVDPQRVLKSLTFTFASVSPKCKNPLAAEKCRAGIFAISALPAASSTPTLQHSTTPASADAGWQNAINLLPLIDIEKDKVSGTWTAANGELSATDVKAPSQKLQSPYKPPEEYDCRVSFTPTGGMINVAAGLSAAGHSFVCLIKTNQSDHVMGFEAINKKAVLDNSTAAHLPHLECGRRYTIVAEVRKDGVTAYLDGKRMTAWQTNYRDMSPWAIWKFNDDTLLGIGCVKTTAIFHEMKVREVTGKGTFTRGAPASAAAGDWTTLPNGWRVGKPVNLGPTVNSDVDDLHPTLSGDGLTLLFSSERKGGKGSGRIWACTRRSTTDAWGLPRDVEDVNTASYTGTPCLSPDGLTLFYCSTRPGGQGGGDLWMCSRRSAAERWSKHENLGTTINTRNDESQPSLSADGLTLFFGSGRPGGCGSRDLWMSTRPQIGAAWSAPLNLGPPVNSPQHDDSPCLSADGLSLFFASDRDGSRDLWMSVRRGKAEPFGEPVNLGPTINTQYEEFAPWLSADNRALYFSSDRPGGQGKRDLWQVPILPPDATTPPLQNSNTPSLQSPALSAFCAEVAALPAEQQVARVVAKLKELNPGFDGKETHHINEGAVETLNIKADGVRDISPVSALTSLQTFICTGSGPQAVTLSDLSPLRGMKALKKLMLMNTRVSDLTPLRGMPLADVHCRSTLVTDLSPLSDARLEGLDCTFCPVVDLTLLDGMPLRRLYCDLAVATEPRNAKVLRSIKTLETINYLPAAEFWKKVEAEQAAREAFTREVAALPAEQQVARVVAKLKELNPGYDSTKAKIEHKIENGHVVEFAVRLGDVKDISPVRALAHLERLDCRDNPLEDLSPLRGLALTRLGFSWSRVSNLSPLRGMPLTDLDTTCSPVADLSPLQGMKLTRLSLYATRVSDLTPLKGMPITWLNLNGATRITDLSPLTGMPLEWLGCLGVPAADLTPVSQVAGPLKVLICDFGTARRNKDVLRRFTTLEAIANQLYVKGHSAAEFFKLIEASELPNTPARLTPADDAAWQSAINLRPLMDLQKDRVDGEWRLENNELISDPASMSARVAIPYRPPDEYDFRIVFTRRGGNGDVIQILSRAGRAFAWKLGAYENTWSGFEQLLVNGVAKVLNQAPASVPQSIENGRRYTMLIQVRKEGVRVYLDGALLTWWKTDYQDLSLDGHLRLPDPNALGIGSFKSEVVFHRIEVREVTGKGTLLRKPSN